MTITPTTAITVPTIPAKNPAVVKTAEEKTPAVKTAAIAPEEKTPAAKAAAVKAVIPRAAKAAILKAEAAKAATSLNLLPQNSKHIHINIIYMYFIQ